MESLKIEKYNKRIHDLLTNYDIVFNEHVLVKSNSGEHEFLFELPEYHILIDDEDKSIPYDSIVPSSWYLHLVEIGREERSIKALEDLLKIQNPTIFDMDSHIFKWCREVGFPYDNTEPKKMKNDFNTLCRTEFETFSIHNSMCLSIINQFHRSLYECRVTPCAYSPLEAWDNDTLMKKVIANRLIYKDDVNPQKILKGYNIAKVCPTVSKFKPVLAKYLTTKYLRQYRTVFDPFSGFSGRMLGVVAAHRKYEGQDLNEKVVKESNQIMDFLKIHDLATVINKDIFQSEGEHECLLTCPPYGTKEIYNKETVFQSCDDWIDECLKRFKCKTYVFVVDVTERYKDYVVETIHHSSHFVKTEEKIIVINK